MSFITLNTVVPTMDQAAYPQLDVTRTRAVPISGLGAAIGPTSKTWSFAKPTMAPSTFRPSRGAIGPVTPPKTWSPVAPSEPSTARLALQAGASVAEALAPVGLDIYRARLDENTRRREERLRQLQDQRQMAFPGYSPTPSVPWPIIGGAAALLLLVVLLIRR